MTDALQSSYFVQTLAAETPVQIFAHGWSRPGDAGTAIFHDDTGEVVAAFAWEHVVSVIESSALERRK